MGVARMIDILTAKKIAAVSFIVLRIGFLRYVKS
jgi:hypothetical protein